MSELYKMVCHRKIEGMSPTFVVSSMNEMVDKAKAKMSHFDYDEWKWVLSMDVISKLRESCSDLSYGGPMQDRLFGIRIEKDHLRLNYIVLQRVDRQWIDTHNPYLGGFVKAHEDHLDAMRYLVGQDFDGDTSDPWTRANPAMKPFNLPMLPKIKKVIFNDPATIVIWADNTKTIVKAQEDDFFDPEKGLAMAISKKALGNDGKYFNEFKKWLPEEKEMESKQKEKTEPLLNPETKFCAECEHRTEVMDDEDGPCFRCFRDPARPNFRLRDIR